MWSNLAALHEFALREVARDQTGRVKKLEIIRRQGGGRPALPGILSGSPSAMTSLALIALSTSIARHMGVIIDYHQGPHSPAPTDVSQCAR